MFGWFWERFHRTPSKPPLTLSWERERVTKYQQEFPIDVETVSHWETLAQAQRLTKSLDAAEVDAIINTEIKERNG